MKPLFLTVAAFVFMMYASACGKDCKQCQLIEENTATGNKVETDLGEYCDHELDEIEEKELFCTDVCYYECQ